LISRLTQLQAYVTFLLAARTILGALEMIKHLFAEPTFRCLSPSQRLLRPVPRLEAPSRFSHESKKDVNPSRCPVGRISATSASCSIYDSDYTCPTNGRSVVIDLPVAPPSCGRPIPATLVNTRHRAECDYELQLGLVGLLMCSFFRSACHNLRRVRLLQTGRPLSSMVPCCWRLD